ncbi:MAG: glycine cleavage system aminomethyltransferase GcvT [Magnetovibrio sp.]|nr:glycine cleavage system aminomethyltransferase GcvT [Magnetovibrio sp.]
MAEPQDQTDTFLATPLDAFHRDIGGRMVPFAGYAMPVQYPAGIIAEHRQTREAASLFDVSHMGQVVLSGGAEIVALERLVPGDIEALKPGRMRYTMLTNEAGGIIDDLMITRADGHLFVVVNAARFDVDMAHLRANLGDGVDIEVLEGRGLLALQGPAAAAALAELAPATAEMPFMSSMETDLDGIAARVNRCGYTGEDGFEISVAGGDAEALARKLLADDRVEPAGLGARDTLRLEAGLCLYGQDIDETTTPVEAGLIWTISKRRRAEGGFPGADVIQGQIAGGAPRRLVGIAPEGRAPARSGTAIASPGGAAVGTVTSGAFGPTVESPVAMGYVDAAFAEPGTALELDLRGKPVAATVAALPFAPHRYYKP